MVVGGWGGGNDGAIWEVAAFGCRISFRGDKKLI